MRGRFSLRALGLDLATRVLAVFLYAYPGTFRARYRGPMLRAFRDACDNATGWGVAHQLLVFVGDAVVSGVAERMGRRADRKDPRRRTTIPKTLRSSFMDRCVQDLRFAVRTLVRRPVFTVVVVLTLALGVGATSAIFSVVNAILVRPLPYENPEELVTVWQDHTRLGGPATEWASPPNFMDWRDQSSSFSDMAAWSGGTLTLTGDREAARVVTGFVTESFFRTLGARFVGGRAFGPEEDIPGGPNVVVFGNGFWRREFGADPSMVGSAITLNGVPYTVVGILEDGFEFDPLPQVEMWSPIRLNPEQCGRGCVTIQVVGRLAPGTTVDEARTDLETIATRLEATYANNTGVGVTVVPLKEFLVGDIQLALVVLLVSVALVLLVACANVANLLLARATSRETELAVRSALGASRRRIVQQLLIESFTLAAIGGVVGLGLGIVGARVFTTIVPNNLPLPGLDEISVDFTVLGFTLAVIVVTGLLFGLLPALQASRADIAHTIKDGGRGGVGRARQRVRSVLVVVEVAVAILLLTGAGLFLRSFSSLMGVELGFEPDGVMAATVNFPASQFPEIERVLVFQEALLERVRALPGVEHAALTSVIPLSGQNSDTGFRIRGRPDPPPDQPQTAWYRRVSPDYLHAMGLRLVQGRFLEPRDRRDAPQVAVINETMANQYWPGSSPVGEFLLIGREVEIVGVVGNIKNFSLDLEEPAALYLSNGQFTGRFVSLVVRHTGGTEALGAGLRRELAQLDPNLPLGTVSELATFVSQSVADRRAVATLIGLFAALAMVLAAVGLYGLMNYAVALRTHEIGIRITLGADRGKVLALVLGQGMGLTLAGIGLGVLGAVALSRFVASLLFGVTATDPVTFGSVPLLLLLVALIAVYVPARRATKVEPVEALRSE